MYTYICLAGLGGQSQCMSGDAVANLSSLSAVPSPAPVPSANSPHLCFADPHHTCAPFFH